MKAYWIYTCEFGHKWMLFRDEDESESPEDAICPYDHPHKDEIIPFFPEAVTLQKERLLDVVQVSIRPAARIVNAATNQVDHEYEFYLVITDLHSNRERMSERSYSWQGIKQLLDGFRNQSAEHAWRLMDKLDANAEIAEQNDAPEAATTSAQVESSLARARSSSPFGE